MINNCRHATLQEAVSICPPVLLSPSRVKNRNSILDAFYICLCMCEGRLGRGQGHPTPDIVTLHHLFLTFSEPVKKWPIKHEHYPKTTITFFHSLTLTLDSSMDLNIYFWGLIRVFVHLLFEKWPWREQNSVKHWGTFDRLPVFGQRPWRGQSYVEHRGVLFIRLFVPPPSPQAWNLLSQGWDLPSQA